MRGETFVDEGIVGRQQLGDRPILAHDRVEQHLDLRAHRLPQRIVEVGIERGDRRHAVEAAQVQPLPREVHRQRLRLRMREHPLHLLLEDGLILEPALGRDLQQRIIGRAAPQEERQP